MIAISAVPGRPSDLGRTRQANGRFVLAALAIALWIGIQPALALTDKKPGKEPNDGKFNTRGNILIADQFNNRVIEVDPKTHAILWQFGDGSSVAGPTSVVAPNDAERVGEWTLISGTGAPAGAEPNCPDGCPDNRVFLVDRAGRIFWQYGRTGVAGADFNELDTPVCAVFLPCSHVLITDQGNNRVIEVSIITKEIVWQYGMTGVAGTKRNQLNSPNSAELLENGNILIADEGNDRVLEVNRAHETVWQYGEPNHPKILNGPAFASRLPSGDTLITDSSNNRIIEIDKHGHVVLEYATNKRPGSVADPLPTRAVRLENGNTLISDQFNHQVIEIDGKLKIVFAQGTIAVAGDGFNQLNAPYDAKVIGDYTGLTPPFVRSWCVWCEGPKSEPDCPK
jgi:outer membrane protein assembly factor BamB